MSKDILLEDFLYKVLPTIKNKTITYVSGMFDELNDEHISFLQRCSQASDILIVGLQSDQWCGIIKGPGKPVWNEKKRIDRLSILPFIDHIIVFDSLDAIDHIEEIIPDVLIVSSQKDTIVGRETVQEFGGRIDCIKYTERLLLV